MNEPPNSRYFGGELAAASPSCGSRGRAASGPPRPPSRRAPTAAGPRSRGSKWRIAAPVRWPWRALGEHGRLRDQVRAGLEVATAPCRRGRGPCRPCGRPPPGRPRRAACSRASRRGCRRPPPRPAAPSQRPSCATEVTWLPWLRNGGGVGLQRDRALRVRHEVDACPFDRPERRPVLLGQVREQPLHRRRVHHRARQQVRAGVLALLDQRHRHLAERLHQRLVLGEQLHQPDRAGEAGRAAADDRDADLDPLVLGIGGRADELLGGVDRRRELDRGAWPRSARPSWPSRPR